MSSKYQIVFPLAYGAPRLANQMFQYAVARVMALRTNSSVVLTTDRLNSGAFSFHQYFKNIPFDTQYTSSNFNVVPEKIQFELVPEVFTTELKSSMVLQGWFQHYGYFKGYEEEICNMFEFNDDIQLRGNTYLNEIKERYPQKQIVGFHLRRPDVKNDPHFIYTTYTSTHIVNLLKKFDISNTIFLFFSSDKTDCLEKFGSIFDLVTHEWVDFGEADSLYIMSQCDHNIIGASTYSWWAAYLNKHDDKRVIIPSPFFSPISNQRTNIVDGYYVPGWEVFELYSPEELKTYEMIYKQLRR
jgi:hypothetical protein